VDSLSSRLAIALTTSGFVSLDKPEVKSKVGACAWVGPA
jgi:hypothetical protein